jgi:transcription elongation factor Elf1
MPLSQEELKIIGERIEEKIKIKRGRTELTCPVCGNTNFQLMDGYTRRDLSEKPNEVKVGGTIIPSVTAVCTNCGHILDFALGSLGLLETKKGKENGETKK